MKEQVVNSYTLHRNDKSWRRILLIAFMTLLTALLVTIAVIRHVYNSNLKPIGASQKSQLVTVRSGATVKEIAKQLEEAGLIRKSWAFETYVRTKNLRDKVQAGTYALRPNQSTPEIVTVLTQGEIATDSFTILPAQRIDQIRKAFIKAGFSVDAVDAALNPALYINHPALVDKPRTASLEGYLYPETFQKTADTKPETIIKASLDEMQKHLTPEIREGIVRQGLTVHQGVILASIVEQEVSNPADKPMVAQVFLKRFHENMTLGSDVTVIYGAVLDGKEPTLAYDSPYNTHLHPGLTPGPISNVGASSLQAVAKPAATDYLFFVAGDDGKTYFSRTVEEHDALTREHCKKLCN
jgi:UPF0755 protein